MSSLLTCYKSSLTGFQLVLDFSSAFPQKGAVALYQCPGCLIPVLVLAVGVCLHGAADNLHVILDDRLSRPPCYV